MTAGKVKPIFEVVIPLGLPFKVALDWRYPAPHKNEEKTETPSFPSKNTTLEKILLIRDRACDLLIR